MAFRPIQFDSGKLIKMPVTDATEVTKGDAMWYDSTTGYLKLGTTGTTNVTHVAQETVTTTSAGQKVLCIDVNGVKFEADTTDAPVVADDVGTLADLTNEYALALGTSTHDVFYVERVKMPLTDKKVVGYFRQQTDA